MKVGRKILKWAGILILVGLVASCVRMFYLVSDAATSCYEDSEAVAYARSLSTERLERLYFDMESYSIRDDLSVREKIEMNEGIKIPKEFADLEILKLRPEYGTIMINGCFDHFVNLTFKGVGIQKNYDKQIVLSWGEPPHSYGEEILWSSEK